MIKVGESKVGGRAYLRGAASMVVAVASLWTASCAQDATRASRSEFTGDLRSATEAGSGPDTANGAIEATYDPATHVLDWQVKWARLKGSDAKVQFTNPVASSSTPGGLTGTATLGLRGARDLLDGKVHVNLTTSAFPNGEVRGRLHPDASQPTPGQIAMTAIMLGSKEPRPTGSTGIGLMTATYRPADRQLDWQLYGLALTGQPIVAMFESNSFTRPIGGNGVRGRLTLSDEEAAALNDGRWTVNVVTDDYPLGEIRGRLVPRK